ncbi:MAG: hypothetical protein EB084_22870 [Proteobacteria bacterium]|nr:hypothetical protein [Pseudomonadota bacterium]
MNDRQRILALRRAAAEMCARLEATGDAPDDPSAFHLRELMTHWQKCFTLNTKALARLIQMRRMSEELILLAGVLELDPAESGLSPASMQALTKHTQRVTRKVERALPKIARWRADVERLEVEQAVLMAEMLVETHRCADEIEGL